MVDFDWDNWNGDCLSVSWLMHNCLQLLGIDGSEARCVYACHADWSHLWHTAPFQWEWDPNCPFPGRVLKMWYGDVENPENNFQGCYYYDGKWWRGGFGDFKKSAKQVLKSVCGSSTKDGAKHPHQAWSDDLLKAVPYPN